MDRKVKIFCSGKDQKDLLSQKELKGKIKVVEKYKAFLLIEVSEAIRDKITRIYPDYPMEDITDHYTLQVGERTIDTSIPRVEAKGKVKAHPAYEGIKPPGPGRHHYLVQFHGPIKEEWLKKIKTAGGELREPFGDFTYLVRANETTLKKVSALSFVRWAGHLPHEDRISPAVLKNVERGKDKIVNIKNEDLPRTQVVPGTYMVEFLGAQDLSKAVPEVKRSGIKILDADPNGKVIAVEIKGTAESIRQGIGRLSSIHGVRFIRERSLKRPSNNVAAQIMGTAASQGTSGPGLSGEGEYIGICDTGLDTGDLAALHQDFSKRVYSLRSYPITKDFNDEVKNPGGDDGPADLDSGHGTHVTGSVLGDGAASEGLPGLSSPIRGLAYKAKLVFQAVEQEMKWKDPADVQRYGRYLLAGIPLDLKTLFADAYEKHARIHSNSWGGGAAGEYDSSCEQLDRFVWEHKAFCVLVAAGNDGTDKDGDGKINLKSVTSPATAKNCITVGACENRRPAFNADTYGGWWPEDYPAEPIRSDPMANKPDQVAAFSSRGPASGMRIKPDVVGPGTFILSTRSSMIPGNDHGWKAFPYSKKYFYMGGTSMATPLTAGAVALIREYLRTKKKIKNPSAALLKAAIIAGAARLPGYGPTDSVADNHQGYGRVNVDAITAPAKPATAQFIDRKQGLGTGELWRHAVQIKSGDVPLRIALAYSDYPGPSLVNNLNLIVRSPIGKAFFGNNRKKNSLDAKNNVEVIQVRGPAAGQWVIEIVGSNIPNGPQDFALVCLGDLK